MKKRKNLKRALAFFGVILTIFSISSIFCFADFYGEPVDYSYYAIDNTLGAQFDVYPIDMQDDGTFENFTARYGSKLTGVVGATFGIVTNDFVYNSTMIAGELTYRTTYDSANNPRFTFNIGRGQFLHSNQTLPLHNYVGWTIKVTPTSGDLTGVYIRTYRTHSFTLDYSSEELYYLPMASNSDMFRDDYLRLPLLYQYNFITQWCSLYLYTSNGIMLLDEMHLEGDGLDFTSNRFGVFDSINANNNQEILVDGWTIYSTNAQYTEAYNLGFDRGVKVGKERGFIEGKRAGKIEGIAIGKDEGYGDGYQDGMIDGARDAGLVIDVPRVIDSYFSGVRTFLDRAFDFEIFGINIAGLIIVLICLSVVGFIIKMVI